MIKMPKKYKQTYRCNYCRKSYTVKDSLVHHISTKHPHILKRRKLLSCPYCKYYFPSDITIKKAHILQFHRAEHDDNSKKYLKEKSKYFLCDYCNVKFYIKTNLIQHIKNIHNKSETSDKIYSCEMCTSHFKTRGWLGRHITKCHVNKDNEVPDDNSKEVNDVISNLKILNAQSDILACAIGASELDFENLNVELKSTVPQTDILAQAIGTTKLDFVPNIDIRKHEVLKENDAQMIKCSLCKFKTKRISFLKRHMISHSTAKEYQCPHCPTKCGYLYNLKHHILIKHIINNNVDTKKKKLKKNPIKNVTSLPILFENSNLSIDDSILNDMLKDIPSDIELPSSLIDIDNVLKNSEVTPELKDMPSVIELPSSLIDIDNVLKNSEVTPELKDMPSVIELPSSLIDIDNVLKNSEVTPELKDMPSVIELPSSLIDIDNVLKNSEVTPELKDIPIDIELPSSLIDIDNVLKNLEVTPVLKDIPIDIELPSSLIDIDNVLKNSEITPELKDMPSVIEIPSSLIDIDNVLKNSEITPELKDMPSVIEIPNSLIDIDNILKNSEVTPELKDMPSVIELPSSLIDIDNVLKKSEVTPVPESPVIDKVLKIRKESVNTVSSNSYFNAIFKTPVSHKLTTAVNALRDHDYCSEKLIEANGSSHSTNHEIYAHNTNQGASRNKVAISKKPIEIPDSSDILIEDLLDLAENSYPDPLANKHFNADIDNEILMNCSFGKNNCNSSINKHTPDPLKKSTPKVVILKNELLCGSRKYVPPMHNVVNDCIIYGKDYKQIYSKNVNEIFPNAVFTPSIDTVNNNFTTFEVVSKGIATDVNHRNDDRTSQNLNLDQTYKFSNQRGTNATNAPIITDTEYAPAIGASNSTEDGDIIIDTYNDHNIDKAYELKASSTAFIPVEDINMITNKDTCPKDMPTIDQCVNFDLDVILSSDSNKQVTVEQIKSIFGNNTPESNHNPNLSPIDKENAPPAQRVPDEFVKDGTSNYIYDVDDIIGALEGSEQTTGTELSVPLSNILACDPTHKDCEEATRNAIANEVMCNDGNTEELVMKLLSQDTIKTLSNAKYGVSCEICNRTFRRARNLREHIQIVHNKQEYTCDICGKTLHAYKSLKVHIQSHSGKVQCQVCGEFIMASSMSTHMRKHNNKTPYLCALCGRKFATFSKKKYHILRSHLRTDTSTTKSSLLDMINDINESSSDDMAVPPVITTCVNAILEKQRQLKPIVTKREVKLKEYECKYCEKVFNYLFNYKRHLQTHNTEESNKNNRFKRRRKKARKNVASLAGLELNT